MFRSSTERFVFVLSRNVHLNHTETCTISVVVCLWVRGTDGIIARRIISRVQVHICMLARVSQSTEPFGFGSSCVRAELELSFNQLAK